MLCCYVSHVIRLYTARVKVLVDEIKSEKNSTLDTANKLFDAFQRCRREGQELSDEIDHITDWFPLILALAIVLQAIAVFQFAGEWFSLIYMLQNIVCLLNMVWECHNVAQSVSDLVESIINLPTDSVLGDLGSNERSNMLLTLQRRELLPHVHAFGYAFSVENFQNIILLSITAIGSFLWNQVEEIVSQHANSNTTITK